MNHLSTIPVQAQDFILPYSIGALLYCPATNEKITEMLLQQKITGSYSLAFCLEDAISDNAIEFGKSQIKHTLKEVWLRQQQNGGKGTLPKIFIRVKYPSQITELFAKLEKYQELLSGFILPKYSVHNAESFHRNIRKINAISSHKIWMLPIMENSDLIPLHSRYGILKELKAAVDSMANYVLNVRVGSNDLLKDFGIRRSHMQTIYDVKPISSILSDIITTFGQDYVVSGPVFEYFQNQDGSWADGFRQELAMDRLNGFIGKTVIHPNQIPIVNEAMKVSKTDYDDAQNILHFQNPLVQVTKSAAGERMNEIKTHLKWAEKTMLLASIYGVTT